MLSPRSTKEIGSTYLISCVQEHSDLTYLRLKALKVRIESQEGSLCVSLAIRMLTSIVALNISNLKGAIFESLSGLLQVKGPNCPDDGEILYV